MTMNAPKINDQAMQEVYIDYTDLTGNWCSSFNSGMLEIRVFKNRTGGCTFRITYDGVLINSYADYGLPILETPQAAADEAMKYLSRLQNLLSNLGFIITW